MTEIAYVINGDEREAVMVGAGSVCGDDGIDPSLVPDDREDEAFDYMEDI